MRHWRLVPLLALFLFLPFACSDSEAPSDPGAAGGVLKGRVVDSSEGQALGGMVVRIEGTDQTAVTAADGTFAFTGLPGGNLTVVVEPAPGAAYQTNRIEVSVRPGDTVNLDCTVLPEGAIAGPIAIYPSSARVGVLESVQFHIGGTGGWIGVPEDGTGVVPYRPTWSIRCDSAIGVVSREGIFIGTAPGRGQVVASLSDSVSAVAEIEVVADGDIARIVLHPSYLIEVPEGESRYVAAYAINGAGEAAGDVSFVWSVEPVTLGTIEAATDLTAEQQAEIIARLWYGWEGGSGGPIGSDPEGKWLDGRDSTIVGPGDPDTTGPIGPPPPDIDLANIALARFTSSARVPGEARGEIRVGAAGASWTESVAVIVLSRGTPSDLRLFPEEATVAPRGEAWFFASAVNEWGRSVDGLTYAWSVEPASLGTLEEVRGPWIDPADPGHSGGGPEGPCVPNVPLPPSGPDGTFSMGGNGVMFLAASEGEGVIRCVASDPVTGVSLEKTARVRVAPSPALDRIVVRPDPIEAAVGDSVFVEAAALNSRGDIDRSARIEWRLAGDAGVFIPVDGRGWGDPDSSGSPGLPDGTSGDDPDEPPTPGVHGMAHGYFFAHNPGGTGTLTATAANESGAIVTVDVAVRVRSR